jgi:hypothetical protein
VPTNTFTLIYRLSAVRENLQNTKTKPFFSTLLHILYIVDLESSWLSDRTPDCNAAVSGSHPAPAQSTVNSINPYVGRHRYRKVHTIYEKRGKNTLLKRL